MTRLLLVEDEPGLRLTLGDRLTSEGFEVVLAASGEDGVRKASEGRGVDLILLDVMLPGIDGFEVCRRLRRERCELPILMLTARDRIADRVHGLRLGADDYLVKPFDPEELVARIHALLRRAAPVRAADTRCFGDVEIDLRGMCVRRAGAEVELAALEYQLLTFLVENEGRALTRAEILREVWGYERVPHTRTVDVHMTWLREKLERDRAAPRYLRTVRGVGYKFVGDDAPDP
ncbi:MAG: response regulator transcription factor [Planctomycetota bacterium]